MRVHAGLLAITVGLACVVLAKESTQKPAARIPPCSQDVPTASWSIMAGSNEGQPVESEGENRIVFVPFGAPSKSLDEMRARLADPQQRAALRAEQRASLEQTYRDVEEELNLDSTTREALMELLTDQSMESLDKMVRDQQQVVGPSMQDMVATENKKLDELREVLGESGLARFQEYITTSYERRQVREVDEHLGVNDKLSREQKTRLVRLFTEKKRMAFAPLAPSRMPDLLRSRDPGSPTFREDMQRDAQLAAIEANQQMLRQRETSNRWIVEHASGFLTPAQNAALAKANEADMARQRKWIEQARVNAGLDRAIPESRHEESTPLRKPASGDVTLDLVLRVDGGEPVHVSHTGANGVPLKFKASEDLFVEAEWTMFEDNWVDVRLSFFEEGPNGRRRLQGGLGLGTMGIYSGDSAPGGIDIEAGGSSGSIVMGRKAYSVELRASAVAR